MEALSGMWPLWQSSTTQCVKHAVCKHAHLVQQALLLDTGCDGCCNIQSVPSGLHCLLALDPHTPEVLHVLCAFAHLAEYFFPWRFITRHAASKRHEGHCLLALGYSKCALLLFGDGTFQGSAHLSQPCNLRQAFAQLALKRIDLHLPGMSPQRWFTGYTI